jgi:putative FmdB family regulatory protein
MPTYEYACSACGNEWEQTQRITEAPVDVCPVCGKSTAHRLISRGTNFILKGGGWYSDLYSSPKPSADAAKPSTEGAEKKSDGDNKPAAAAGVPPEKTAKTAKPANSANSANNTNRANSTNSANSAAKPASADTAASSSGPSSGKSSGTSSAPTS